MSEIGERELRNLGIDTGNITFRKKNRKRARSVIPTPEPAQLPALPESPPPQPETSTKPQPLFSTKNTPHSTGETPAIIFLQPLTPRPPFRT